MIKLIIFFGFQSLMDLRQSSSRRIETPLRVMTCLKPWLNTNVSGIIKYSNRRLHFSDWNTTPAIHPRLRQLFVSVYESCSILIFFFMWKLRQRHGSMAQFLMKEKKHNTGDVNQLISGTLCEFQHFGWPRSQRYTILYLCEKYFG